MESEFIYISEFQIEIFNYLQAANLKTQGNLSYTKKDFDTALSCYTKALTLDPTNMTYKLNIAAVYFEQKKYEDSIKTCLDAIELGRENRAGKGNS